MAQPSPRQDSETIYFEETAFLDHKSAGVFHGFFGRRGGDSKDVYASLNCGVGSGDDPDSVQKNRRKIAEIAGVAPEHFITLHQIHSNICTLVEKPWNLSERPKADAFVTQEPEIVLGILTADCVPVLFYGESDTGKPVIGAAHAGWQGALKGVLESTVTAMNDLGVEIANIRACIGPCIGKASYEVTKDFAQAFLNEDDAHERFFQSSRKEGHLMFDLPGYCAGKLAKAGLCHVFIKDLDTYAREEDFFSYRRSIHRGEKDYGRQASVICIK